MLISRDFDELRLRQRGGDAQNRFVGKQHRAFGHRVDVAGEAKLGEIIEQVLTEPAGALEPVDLGCREAQAFEIIERLLQAGRDEKAAAPRQIADEKLEDSGLGLTMVQVGLDHVDLVEVRQQRARPLGHRRRSRGFPQLFRKIAHSVVEVSFGGAASLYRRVMLVNL